MILFVEGEPFGDDVVDAVNDWHCVQLIGRELVRLLQEQPGTWLAWHEPNWTTVRN